ncbi:MAG TPA: cupredoxin domain-containing protein [Acidimicrobiia bacterium]|jgi:plastocyanin|nr:cupredoxin domain-containing protein [Acidimicrobiia bacterium]
MREVSRVGRLRAILPLILAMAMVVTACEADDGGEVRNLDSSGSASASGSASGSGSATSPASATGSGSGVNDAECKPLGTELEAEANTEVEITVVDFAFDPSEIEVPAGVVTFEVTNEGTEAHELAFLPGGGEVPFTEVGVPDEEALEAAGAFELEAFGPGQTCHATFDLDPGTYTVFCIVETEDGATHYEHGMEGTLVVTG